MLTPPPIASRFSYRTWWLFIFSLLLADQLSKSFIEHFLQLSDRLAIIPGFFDLTLRYNSGAAFSFLSEASGWQRWFFIAIGLCASALIAVMLRRTYGRGALGLSLILSGALGNVADRIFRGHVVDFILIYSDPFYWPAFNFADSTITVGVLFFLSSELWPAAKHTCTLVE